MLRLKHLFFQYQYLEEQFLLVQRIVRNGMWDLNSPKPKPWFLDRKTNPINEYKCADADKTDDHGSEI